MDKKTLDNMMKVIDGRQLRPQHIMMTQNQFLEIAESAHPEVIDVASAGKYGYEVGVAYARLVMGNDKVEGQYKRFCGCGCEPHLTDVYCIGCMSAKTIASIEHKNTPSRRDFVDRLLERDVDGSLIDAYEQSIRIGVAEHFAEHLKPDVLMDKMMRGVAYRKQLDAKKKKR